jgi:Tol biopolymer transport system component
VNPTPLGAARPQSEGGAVQQSRPQATPSPAPTSTTSLTGRIVYAGSGGLHIYNVATRADVSLGVSGINPKFSPDGTLITYVNSGIYVMNSDGTNRRLLNATGNVPSFDPTSTKIVYADNGIWTINVSGGPPTEITSAGDGGRHPAWSPDGTQIAYHASVGSVAHVFTIPAIGGTSTDVCSGTSSILDLVWLAPNSKPLFAMNGLYTCDPTSGTLRQLASGGFEPSWSPDATHIAWTKSTSGSSAGIWIMNADGTGQQGPVIAKGRQGSWGP